MKLWITGSVAATWIAVFSAWVVSQEGPAGGAGPAMENGQASQLTQGEEASRPRGRAAWRPREHPHGGPGGFDRSRGEVFGLGMVLLATLDTNTDAIISKTEIERAQEALAALDENGDGDVSREELFRASPRMMEVLNKWPESRGGPGGFRGPGPYRWNRGGRRWPPTEEAEHTSDPRDGLEPGERGQSQKRPVSVLWLTGAPRTLDSCG